MKQIIETWQIHNRINLYLLNAIKDESLLAVSASKGRNVGEQFAHLHNVRLVWLKVASPELLTSQVKLEKNAGLSKKLLAGQLTDSAEAISKLLEKGFVDGKIKGFKPHPAAFFGYLVSHESHHRGQIVLILKQSGNPLPQKEQYGLWEWGSR